VMGDGSDGYYGSAGGAIDNEFGSVATISSSEFTGNRAQPGPGDAGSEGGGGALENEFAGTGSILRVTNCPFSDNQAIAGNGGGVAFGGGIENNSILSVSQSAFDHNLARGGDGGTISESDRFIGLGFGGGLDNFFGTATIDQCIFTGNQAVGGSGGNG